MNTKRTGMTSRIVRSLAAAAAFGSLTAFTPGTEAFEGSADEVEIVFACSFSPCENKPNHYCVDLQTRPYEWHSGCYPDVNPE